jgi:hypothetical protein
MSSRCDSRRMNELPRIGDLIFASEVRGLGLNDRRYRREVATGELVRIHRGAFVERSDWDLWTPHMRYQMKCIGAATAGRSRVVLSHQSAAAIHQIPQLGAYPALVHILASVQAGTRTEHGFRKHATPFPDIEVESRGELRVTTLVRTLIDIASTATFPNAVAALDWGLRPQSKNVPPRLTREDLLDCADRLGLSRGRSNLMRALDFANPLAESAGESFSRVVIHQLGFPAPELQKEFFDDRGFIGRVDFWWPDHNLVGEFDGVAKYIRDDYTRGLSPAQIVIAEKIREDRIRATGPGFVRWRWEHPANPQSLFFLLEEAGLPSWRRGAYGHHVSKPSRASSA